MIVNLTDSFARPGDTTAYADGDLVANSTTAGSVVPLVFRVTRLGAGRGVIRAARIFKDDETLTAASFNVHLFSQSPTVNNGDNGALSPVTTQYYLGAVAVDIATNGVASATDAAARGSAASEINFDLQSFGEGERRLYGLLEATGTYGPASAEQFTVTLEIASRD